MSWLRAGASIWRREGLVGMGTSGFGLPYPLIFWLEIKLLLILSFSWMSSSTLGMLPSVEGFLEVGGAGMLSLDLPPAELLLECDPLTLAALVRIWRLSCELWWCEMRGYLEGVWYYEIAGGRWRSEGDPKKRLDMIGTYIFSRLRSVLGYILFSSLFLRPSIVTFLLDSVRFICPISSFISRSCAWRELLVARFILRMLRDRDLMFFSFFSNSLFRNCACSSNRYICMRNGVPWP